MPRRKPNPEKLAQKKIQEEIKNNLDAILLEDIYTDSALSPAELPRMKSSAIMDVDQEKQNAASESHMLMDSLVDFYLKGNAVENEQYIDFKQKIDAMNISTMMLQMKTSQHAIGKLLEEIDMGNTAPKMFEVLAQLQSQIMQMPKDYQNYFNKMEDSYKNLKEQGEIKAYQGGVPTNYQQGPQIEYPEQGYVDPETGEYFAPQKQTQQNTQGQPQQSNGIRVRGTKGLMEGLRDILGSEIEDVKFDDDMDVNSVVNAKKKIELGQVDKVESNEDNTLDIEDDLFK